MTLELPRPVPLDLPDEDPTALEELATAVTGGAFHLGLLGVHLTGPAASVRDWVGRDASAAAAQVDALAVLVRAERDAVTSAAARVEAHAGLVRDAVVRVRGLQAAQREEFGAAVRRLSVLVGGPVDPFPAPPPEAVAVVEEFRAAEARRAGAHAALLGELAEDAAATARVLAGCTAVVGGTGAPGDDGRCLRHMALALPGWGDQELAARGAAFGKVLGGQLEDRTTAGDRRWQERAEVVRELAGTPAFADAVITELGTSGLARLLAFLGHGDSPPGTALADVLAAVVTAAARAGGAGAVVLRGRVVDPAGRGSPVPDMVAIGMGELLGIAGTERDGGPPASLVANWGAQILTREAVMLAPFTPGASAVARTTSPWPGGTPDPVETVIDLLLADADPLAAARLLSTPQAWAGLLDHIYLDQPVVARIIALGIEDRGPAGDASVLAGLARFGMGLADGNADDWTVNRTELTWLAPALADAVGTHAGVAVDVLCGAGSSAPLSSEEDGALRGLGYLTLVPEVAARVEGALKTWVQGEVARVDVLPAATAVGAFVALRQYGQRLAYALHGFEQRQEAVQRAKTVNAIDFALQFLGKPGEALGIVAPFVAHWVRADGTWDNGGDGGRVFTAGDARLQALLQVLPRSEQETVVIARQAGAAFVTADRRLGVPPPPTSPSWSFGQALLDSVSPPDPETEAPLLHRSPVRR